MAEDMPASARDWSELPQDALASVFVKLGAMEILMGAGLVCRSWIRAAKLPELWRSVDMARHKVLDEMNELGFCSVGPKINGHALCAMAKVAVDRSGGQLEVFVGKWFVTDELLQYIGDSRSPALKAVGLISCHGVSNKGFTQLISMCPKIEDLLLSFCQDVGGRDVYEAIGKACPKLKRFRMKRNMWWDSTAQEALGVAAMHELRCLTLYGSDITTGDLASVLEGCPHLELLDLRGSFNIVPDDARAMCAGIKSVMLPSNREVEDYEYQLHWLATVTSSDCDFDYNSD